MRSGGGVPIFWKDGFTQLVCSIIENWIFKELPKTIFLVVKIIGTMRRSLKKNLREGERGISN